MNKPVDLPTHHLVGLEDEITNETRNESFMEVLDARLSRRSMLRGGVGSAATAVLGGVGASAFARGRGHERDDDAHRGRGGKGKGLKDDDVIEKLGFSPVTKSTADAVSVPAGYTASVLIALGDPLDAATPEYRNDGTDTDFDRRSGDHHDGMEFFGLSRDGRRDANGSERGLIAINHEATTHPRGFRPSMFIHADGGDNSVERPAAEVDKEMAIHGVAVMEVQKRGGAFSYVRQSPYNRRITPLTPVELTGPLRGHPLMITKYDPQGIRTRGTINNCGTGITPWGTYLTGEENWGGYFTRGAGDDAARNDKSVTSLNRYGRRAGAGSRHGWETAVSADAARQDGYDRWNIGKTGASDDGRDDYRNELNGMGYVVEIDPYDPEAVIKKRTGLGRFAHESAVFGLSKPGRPLAVYMGDDSQNEYVYKWLSEARWTPADAMPRRRMAAGDKYLDQGRLYVARYDADGTGEWIELTIRNPLIAAYANYAFADEADVVVNARLAADAVGATRMDRPEWCAVNPANGEIYLTMTNNSNRKIDPVGAGQSRVDSANPRSYSDSFGGAAAGSPGNINGHIIRMAERRGESDATSFTWDVYLFGAEAGADAGKINLSSLTDSQDFSSPDGLWFSPATGICWIQTDDGAYTDVTNCMMLAGVPGRVGDGVKKTLSYTKADGSLLNVDTYVGKKPEPQTLARFLVGPVDCEITGCTETPDGKALFVNIQHPGEGTPLAAIGNPDDYVSQWPGNAGYGAGKRPRSATIVITKNDGGRIGS
ncbi:MAG: PhoX family phosphatase [Methylibium sp.]|uniref:PhoX family protein n=1 Tax=Methylibium sp. TaxID=2067992 RepID=UPI0017D1EB5F|nr:PhoX family phosphatase [Methylibium sp.]MBA2723231.1 PhoX family phosphatase [Methylibium sp.]MBA3589715.1 PhoX family phosphatase [Methylibium sp.]